jgi:hypothetical protein
MKKLTGLGLVIWCLSGGAMASQTVVDQYVDDAQIVGEAKFEYIFWDVYLAKLYAPSGTYQQDAAYALSLTYLRDFDGEAIAERSIKEMKSQGFKDKQKISEWEDTMKALFPDVSKGQTITGIADAQGNAHFYLDDDLLGTVAEQTFTQQFFAIWLSDKTSEPGLRARLLDLKGDK